MNLHVQNSKTTHLHRRKWVVLCLLRCCHLTTSFRLQMQECNILCPLPLLIMSHIFIFIQFNPLAERLRILSSAVLFSWHILQDPVHCLPGARHRRSDNPHDRPYSGWPGRWQVYAVLSPCREGKRYYQILVVVRLAALPGGRGSAWIGLSPDTAPLLQSPLLQPCNQNRRNYLR